MAVTPQRIFAPVDRGPYTAQAYERLAATAQNVGNVAAQAYQGYTEIKNIEQKKDTLMGAFEETFGGNPRYSDMFTEENKAKWRTMNVNELESAIANFSAAAYYMDEKQTELEESNPQLAAMMSWQVPHINKMFKADKYIEVQKDKIGQLEKGQRGIRAQEFLTGEGGKLPAPAGIRGLATEAQLPIEEAVQYEKAFRPQPRVSTVVHKTDRPKDAGAPKPVKGDITYQDILNKSITARRDIDRYKSLQDRQKAQALLPEEQAEFNRLKEKVVAGRMREGLKLFDAALAIINKSLDPKSGRPKITAFQALSMAQDKLDYGKNLMNRVYSSLVGEPGAEAPPSPSAPLTFSYTPPPVDTSRAVPDLQGQFSKPGELPGPVTVQGEEEEIMQFFE